MATLSELILAFEDLGALREIQRSLAAWRIPSGASWQAIRGSLEMAWTPDLERDLLSLYQELRESSRKTVYFYRTEGSLVQRVAAGATVDASKFSKSFPLPNPTVGDPVVAPRLTHRRVERAGVFLTFCSQREQTVEEEIPDSYLKDSVPVEVRDAKKFLVRRQWLQAFDVVHARHDGIIEVRIDKFNGKRTSPSSEEVLFSLRRWMMDNLVGVTNQQLFGSPINLFPAIRAIYDARDGRLLGVDHDDTESGRRSEKVRDRQRDMRDNNFHKGGARASGAISLYRVDVEWATDAQGLPLGPTRLNLPGGPRSLNDNLLFCAELPGVCNAAAYQYAVSRLLHHAGV